MRRTALWRVVDLALPALNSVVTGLLVGVFANKLFSGEPWTDILRRLGWWHGLLFLWIVLLFLAGNAAWRRHSATNTAVDAICKKHQDCAQGVISSLFAILGTSTTYPAKTSSLNIHLFLSQDVDGKQALVKARQYAYEQEAMPGNYSLDHAVPGEDELVICRAYLDDALVYQELPEDHLTRYNSRIKARIDPDLHWVLACPLHVPNDPPLGVICCFGAKPFFKSVAARRQFEQILLVVSQIAVRELLFPKGVP